MKKLSISPPIKNATAVLPDRFPFGSQFYIVGGQLLRWARLQYINFLIV